MLILLLRALTTLRLMLMQLLRVHTTYSANANPATEGPHNTYTNANEASECPHNIQH